MASCSTTLGHNCRLSLLNISLSRSLVNRQVLANKKKAGAIVSYRSRARRRNKCSKSTSLSNEDVQIERSSALGGEDAAAFDVKEQSRAKWAFFTVELAVVLGVMYLVWIAPGVGVADDLVSWLETVLPTSEAVMVAMFVAFAVVHSGLAYLRPQAIRRQMGRQIAAGAGEQLMGARGFRVLFAALSLPLAVLTVVYFINHRYDGLPLWNLRRQPAVHELVWVLNFLSFFFLYPSTFNLLEVAAVDEPKLHLWETGITRITRHPQSFGQAIWCFAHCLWIGSSFMLTTSAALMAHHLFSTWHGDFRLRRKHGQAFEAVKSRTSIVPFAAIWDGRQKLPPRYYTEFFRLPYLTITFVTLGAYFSHPLMQQASAWLGW